MFPAKLSHLSRLLAQVEAGEEVLIARRGQSVARLVRCQPRDKRQFGAMKGRIRITDAFFEPLPAEELKLWEGNSPPNLSQSHYLAQRHHQIERRPRARIAFLRFGAKGAAFNSLPAAESARDRRS